MDLVQVLHTVDDCSKLRKTIAVRLIRRLVLPRLVHLLKTLRLRTQQELQRLLQYVDCTQSSMEEVSVEELELVVVHGSHRRLPASIAKDCHCNSLLDSLGLVRTRTGSHHHHHHLFGSGSREEACRLLRK